MNKFFIRNQKQDRLLLVNEVSIERLVVSNPNNLNVYEPPKEVGAVILVNCLEFGTYKTYERARQIFDEICNALSGKVMMKQNKSSSKEKSDEEIMAYLKSSPKTRGTVGENDSVELKTLNCDTVYQMPQE